jgi:hypothetical protein
MLIVEFADLEIGSAAERYLPSPSATARQEKPPGLKPGVFQCLEGSVESMAMLPDNRDLTPH